MELVIDVSVWCWLPRTPQRARHDLPHGAPLLLRLHWGRQGERERGRGPERGVETSGSQVCCAGFLSWNRTHQSSHFFSFHTPGLFSMKLDML